MTTFARLYADALTRLVREPGERPLSAGYELGRTAVRQGESLLDLASAHHDALLALVSGSPGDAEAIVRTGGEFFIEAVSAYEMVQRVLQETRETTAIERRQAAILRRLSTFLADASIALDAASSLAEIIQLVAEHAREVIEADACVARLSLAEQETAVALAGEDDASPDLEALFAALAPPSGAVRMTAEQLADHPAAAALSGDRNGGPPVRGWLAVQLTALDGRSIGLLQLFGKRAGEFSELDEAVVVQLAQMASAAVERAQLYAEQHRTLS